MCQTVILKCEIRTLSRPLFSTYDLCNFVWCSGLLKLTDCWSKLSVKLALFDLLVSLPWGPYQGSALDLTPSMIDYFSQLIYCLWYDLTVTWLGINPATFNTWGRHSSDSTTAACIGSVRLSRALDKGRQLLLLSNQWVNWDETLSMTSPEFLPSFWNPCIILVSMATKQKNFKILLLPNCLADIRFLQVMYIDLYGYSENLKNLLRKCQTDFQIIL